MPIYEYECRDCGERFERLTTARERNASAACPQCGSENTERVVSGFAVGRPSKPATGCTTCCPGGTCGV